MDTPTAPRALTSAAAVGRSLLSAGSGLLALAAFAYVIGWRENSAYYSALGASWFASVLGPAKHLEASSWIVFCTLLTTFYAVQALAQSAASYRGLRRAALVTLFAAMTPYVLDPLFPDLLAPRSQSLMLGFGAFLLTVSNGLTLGEVVDRFGENKDQWTSYTLYLLVFTATMTFFVAPDRMGAARARGQLNPDSTLFPQVTLDPTAQPEVWRLVDTSDGKAILVLLAPNTPARFRIVDLTSIRSVATTLSAKT